MSLITASNAVQTNSIDTITATGMTIGNATATSIAIGSSTAGRTPTITIDTLSTLNSNATPAIAIGTSSSTKTIKIGSNSNSVHCSSIDIQSSAINNITATGDISIGNNQTTAGILNLGTAGARAGTINIGTGATRTGLINIGNGGGTGNIAIGSATSATTTGALTASGQITAQAGLAMSNTAITGASSVTATTFIGDLNGNATSATTASSATNIVTTADTSSSADFFPTFVPTGTGGINQGAKTSINFKFKPSTNTLTATTFTGALSGTATNATNVATVVNNNSSASQFFPTFVASNTASNQSPNTTSQLHYIPSTQTLTTGTFSGNLTGNATSATNANNANTVSITTDVVSVVDCFPTFTTLNTASNQTVRNSANLKYVPNTGTLTASAMKTNSLTTETGTGTLTALKSETITIQNDANTVGDISIQNGGATSGNINIKTGSNAIGQVNIASGGTILGGETSVSVSIGAGTTTGEVLLGNTNNLTSINSGTVNLTRNTAGTGAIARFIEMLSTTTFNLIRFHSSGENNLSDSRIVAYGGTAITDKGTIELVAGSLVINGTVVMGTGKNITLSGSTSYSSPSSGQLGYTNNLTPTTASFTVPASTTTSMFSIPVPTGVWIILANCRYGGTGGQLLNVGISNVSNYLVSFSPTSIGVTANTFGNSTYIATNTSSSNVDYYFIGQNNNATSVLVDSIFVGLTRIA